MKTEDIQNELSNKGLRATLHNVAILEVIRKLENHPTAGNIIDLVKEEHPTISSKTVYDVLNVFIDKGLISKVKTDTNIIRYDPIMEQHHHLYSIKSERIKDYFDEELNKLLSLYFKKTKIPEFEIKDIRLQITGKFKKSKRNEQVLTKTKKNYFLKATILTIAILLGFWSASFAQIIVNKGIYKANFSNTYHEPNYVSYTLYKGGGNCNRSMFHFINDDTRLQCATDADYAGSHYDKGHLANAEDFAFDCTKDELTFRYYNCLPQTPNLNRGIWKKEETLIRKWSQTDSLYIICGGVFGNTKIGNIAVPSYCWKVVQSASSGKVLFCGWFSNTPHAKLEKISITEMEKRLNKSIILLK